MAMADAHQQAGGRAGGRGEDAGQRGFVDNQ
jgi:hypothetical protein